MLLHKKFKNIEKFSYLKSLEFMRFLSVLVNTKLAIPMKFFMISLKYERIPKGNNKGDLSKRRSAFFNLD